MNTGGNNAPLIAAGGGVLLFIGLFIGWFAGASAWELFDLVDLLLALLALIAIGIGAMLATGNSANLPTSPGDALTTAGIVALSIVAAFLFEGEERELGIFLALIGSIAIIVGGMQLRGAGPRTTTSRTRADAAPPPPPPPSSGPGAA